MNYFINKLWFGALITPQCWETALKRSSYFPLLVASILFFIVSLCNAIYLTSAIVLLLFWLVLMAISIVSPQKHYMLTYRGKDLHIFFYRYKSNSYKDTIIMMRIFEVKRAEIWTEIESGMKILEYDDYLLKSGFILVRPAHSTVYWQALGNGYDTDYRVKILGMKVANQYAFFYKSKEKTLNIIHNKTVVTLDVDDLKKYRSVIFSSKKANFYDVEKETLSDREFSNAEQAFYLLIKQKENFRLIKLVHDDHTAFAYYVYTDFFYPVYYEVTEEGYIKHNVEGSYIQVKDSYQQVEAM